MTRKDFFLWVAAAFGYRRKKPVDPVFAKRLSPKRVSAALTYRYQTAFNAKGGFTVGGTAYRNRDFYRDLLMNAPLPARYRFRTPFEVTHS